MRYIESNTDTKDFSIMDDKDDDKLDLNFAQGIEILDMLREKILSTRKQVKNERLDPNFYFECEIPASMSNGVSGFARVTVNGDAYNITFHKGTPETAGIISTSKTLH